jgi:predicted amidohydrolase
VLGDVAGNTESLGRLIAGAAAQGARLVVAPETATAGYVFKDPFEAAQFAEPVPGPTTSLLHALCRQHGIYLVVGLVECDGDTGFLYNAAALIGPDGYIGKYRKSHAFLADTRWAVDGDLGFPVFDLPFGRLGIIICIDISYFEPARIAAVKGAQILAAPFASRQPSPPLAWRVRAAENGLYLVASNRTGFERGTRFTGGSSVIGPDGAVISTLGGEPGISVAEVDTDLCGRDLWGFGLPVGDRRPDAYYPLVLRPYSWSGKEVYGLESGGKPLVAAVGCSGSVEDVRRGCGLAWQECLALFGARPDIMVLPERSLPCMTAEEALAFGRRVSEAFQTTMAYGFTETGPGDRAGDHIWNSMALVAPAGMGQVYRQVHLAPRDRAQYTAGSRFATMDLPWGRAGMALGADLFYAETARCLSQMGADIILAGIDSDPEPLADALKDRSRHGNVHIALAARTGSPSIFVADDVAQPDHRQLPSGGVVERLEVSENSSVRTKWVLKKRRPELYYDLVGRRRTASITRAPTGEPPAPALDRG